MHVLPTTLIDGKYRVERALGEGGMGVVVEATHVGLNKRVAIKMLHAEMRRSGEAMERFLREAQVASRLTSDHVARVIDVGETARGEPYLVMELLEGRDLEAELAERGTFAVSDAVDLALEACAGLAEAHALGLVHRDVKPANLFLSRRNPAAPVVLKVLDFGLSKVAGSSDGITLTGTTAGTPNYMSPEQARSAKHVDARTDQHAIALVLYELLTGEPAFDGASPLQILMAVGSERPTSVRAARPDVPIALDLAISRALEKSPDARWPSVAELAEAIAPFGSARAASLVATIFAELGRAPAIALTTGDYEMDSEPTIVRPSPLPAFDAFEYAPTIAAEERCLLARTAPRAIAATSRVRALILLAAAMFGGALGGASTLHARHAALEAAPSTSSATAKGWSVLDRL